MEHLERIKTIYQRYFDAAEKVLREARPGDGLFGLGDDPKKNICHQQFYEALDEAVTEALEQGMTQAQTGQMVSLLLRSEEWGGEQPDMVRWMLVAAQGLTLPAIPRMSREAAAEVLSYYRNRYPVFERLPVQRKVLAELKKTAKARS